VKTGRAAFFSFVATLLAVSAFGSKALSVFGRMAQPGGASSNNGRQAFAVNFRKVHLRRVRQARGRA